MSQEVVKTCDAGRGCPKMNNCAFGSSPEYEYADVIVENKIGDIIGCSEYREDSNG